MPVESSSGFIQNLDALSPDGAEGVNEGDNHLRAFKQIVKNTFPNATAAINPSPSEFNYLVGVTSAIQTQLNTLSTSKGNVTAQTWLGQHTFNVAPIVASATLSTQAPNLGQVSALVGSSPSVAVAAGARKAVRVTADGLAVEGFQATNQSNLRRAIRQARYSFSQL